jgi:Skp family chaperone for outer membrane proteins
MSRLILGVLFIALLLPALCVAQTAEKTPATPASTTITPVKLAWMNAEQAILNCDEGAKMVTEIQKYVDAKSAEMDALRKEVDTLRNNLSVQGPKLTDEARQDLEDKVESKSTILQRFGQDTEKDINSRKDRLTAYVSKRMGPIIEKVAKAKGLDAIQIYNPSNDAWINPNLFVTEDIIKAYNQAYPVAAPKPPTAKP